MNDEIGTNWKLLSRLQRKCPHPALAIEQKTKMELFQTVNVATLSLSLYLSISLYFSPLSWPVFRSFLGPSGAILNYNVVFCTLNGLRRLLLDEAPELAFSKLRNRAPT